MIQVKSAKRKAVASALTFCFFLQQSFCLQVAATQITGVTGNDGIFNIDPTAVNGDVGFRKYNDFNLSEGDIANLIFNMEGKDVSTFVNMVDNTININGIVNSVNKDGAFNDGRVMFVSPNGMVVGASGVLNVGSLSVLTPDQGTYDKFKGSVNNPTLAEDYENILSAPGTGTVKIDGKVLARDFVNINAANIDIANNAQILAGVNDATKILSNKQAENLFNQLVNSDVVSGSSFANDSGNIVITSYGQNGGTSIGGTVKNIAKNGDIEITNSGSNGVNITGIVSNAGGSTTINNTNGAVNISGSVINRGNDELEGLFINNRGSGVTIDSTGIIDNNNKLEITNSGKDDITIAGNVTNKGNVNIKNNAGGIVISGNLDNTEYGSNGLLAITNTGDNGILISGTVSNKANGLTQETSIVNNNSNSGIEITNTGKITTNDRLYINNSGEKGIKIDGNIHNVNRYAGGEYTPNIVISNTDGGVNIKGSVYSEKAGLYINNSGSKGVDIESTGRVSADRNVNINNESTSGINVKGIVNANDINIYNENSDVVIGYNSGKDYLNSKNNVNIEILNGDLLNYGTTANLIKVQQNKTNKNT